MRVRRSDMRLTIRNSGQGLVKTCVVDRQVDHILRIEGHDVIRTGTNVIFGGFSDAIDMIVLWRSELLRHLQDVTALGRFEGSGRKNSGEAVTVFDSDCGGKALQRKRNC